MDIGALYPADDDFKARARKHQAQYRAEVLGVEWDTYGNRLTKKDGEALLIYYDKLGVREAKIRRFPDYSSKRDGDMLRSEHIPFNMFGPLQTNADLAKQVLGKLIGREIADLLALEFEWAPEPRELYLGDRTAFDVYACLKPKDQQIRCIGLGIEVKYTERGYPIGNTESKRVADHDSLYWCVTRKSGAFVPDGYGALASDDLRQIWRNHLLGLAMRIHGDINDFVSVTLYPAGNTHFTNALAAYRAHLSAEARNSLLGRTYESYFEALGGDNSIMNWREYLQSRYVVR